VNFRSHRGESGVILRISFEERQIRRFTGNDYIRDLSSGDVDFVLGWSGDAIQLQNDNPNIRFVMPKEGCMLWSTSMEIPAGAPNPAAAEAWMNFVYDPKVQADIAEYVNYVTPVKGVKPILAKRDPKLAKSKLIFPHELHAELQLRAGPARRAGQAGDAGLQRGRQRVNNQRHQPVSGLKPLTYE
jgi:hypothetical protein